MKFNPEAFRAVQVESNDRSAVIRLYAQDDDRKKWVKIDLDLEYDSFSPIEGDTMDEWESDPEDEGPEPTEGEENGESQAAES